MKDTLVVPFPLLCRATREMREHGAKRVFWFLLPDGQIDYGYHHESFGPIEPFHIIIC